MALWLTVSIWIIYVLWTITEVLGLHGLFTMRNAYYTRTSAMVSILWVVFTICWFSFQFIG